MKKVLIACPTADIKDYCFKEWLNNVMSFTYKKSKIYLCDNSETRDYYSTMKKKYSKLGSYFDIGRVSPQQYMSFKLALAKSHDNCRIKALDGGFDYLLHLESDVFPPIDVIETLMQSKKKVIGALYHIEVGEKSKLMIQNMEDFGDDLRETYNLDDADLSFVDGTIKQVHSCGLGCVLIHRSVLEKVPFRCDIDSSVHPDSFYYSDLDANGIPVFVDTSIYCEHKNQSTLRF